MWRQHNAITNVDFPEKTDLWFTGQTGSGAAASVSVKYDLTLVDDIT